MFTLTTNSGEIGTEGAIGMDVIGQRFTDPARLRVGATVKAGVPSHRWTGVEYQD